MALPGSHCCALPLTGVRLDCAFSVELTVCKFRYFTSVFVSLGVFLFGYDQGVMSGIITYVTIPSRSCIPKKCVGQPVIDNEQRPLL